MTGRWGEEVGERMDCLLYSATHIVQGTFCCILYYLSQTKIMYIKRGRAPPFTRQLRRRVCAMLSVPCAMYLYQLYTLLNLHRS